METLNEIAARIAREGEAAYRASRFSALSTDCFSRFSRDPGAVAGPDEIAIEPGWSLRLAPGASELARLMAVHLADFLERRMGLRLATGGAPERGVLSLEEGGGGDPRVPESFTIQASPGRLAVKGADPRGLRDGIVRLVDLVGFRQAPFVSRGSRVYRPLLPLRLGAVPYLGSWRELVFLGYNAVQVGGGDLYALSRSEAIPALVERRAPLPPVDPEPRRYGLRTFTSLSTRQKFPEGHRIFREHPEIRGARTWSADGEFTICTEHPLVRRYLAESVEGVFRADPELDGALLIVGGESFYHCFMRPFGVAKGHTSCPRCERLGPDVVVSNLVNLLAEAARRVNPRALVVAWPYSAEHVWSSDRAQSGFIARLGPGTAVTTEIEKDEWLDKGEGVRKHLWDYSMDLTGPGERALEQVRLCRQAGVPIYMKSEPEAAFEAAQLPHLPCMDRWVDRAAALAGCGADGAWVIPAFRACYGTSASEINRLVWWDPVPDKEELLRLLAERIAGRPAGPRLREAWRAASEAIACSPEIPPYYAGPTYTGPAHPMCVEREAPLPPVFSGLYLFLAEAADAKGLAPLPTCFRDPRGDRPVFERFYRRMEALCSRAAAEVDAAEQLVEERHRLAFDAEASSIRWLAHSIRSTVSFYASCRLRDELASMEVGTASRERARALLAEWTEVLLAERDNAREALRTADADVRLDFAWGGDHSFPHLGEMLRAKLDLLEREIAVVLPALELRWRAGTPGEPSRGS